MKRIAFWSGLALLALAGAFLGQFVALLVAADGCLDAGGSFNYSTGLCDLNTSQPGMDVSTSWRLWLGVLSLFAGALTLWRSRKA